MPSFFLICLLLLTAPSRSRAIGTSASPYRVLLPDGVRLLLKPETEAETVAITVLVHLERPHSAQEAATSEIVSRALFFSSINRSFDAIIASVAQVGGSLETVHTPDYVAVTCVTIPGQVHESLYLLCEALKNADFAPEALSRAREILQRERLAQEESFFTGYQTVGDLLRGTTTPESEDLERVTSSQAHTWFLRHYVPIHTVVSIAGRFDPVLVQKTMENNLADYDRPALPAARQSDPLFVSSPDPSPFRFTASGQAAYAFVGCPAPNLNSPEYAPFLVLRALLGGGHASRLFRRVRDSLGIGYDVGAVWKPERGDPFVAYLQWDGLTAGSSRLEIPIQRLKLLEAQLDAILTDPPTDAEVSRARSVVIGQEALQHERARDRAFFLAWYEGLGAGFAFDSYLPRLVGSVTREDVLRVARTYLLTRATVLALPKTR